MIYVCLSHDVDRIDKTYQHLTKPLKALLKGNLRLFFKLIGNSFLMRKPYWGFDTIIDIEKRYGIRSTFFFLDESIPFQITRPKTWKLSLGRYAITDRRIAQVIKQLNDGGWEIGLHGSFRSYNNSALLKKEKENLERILGHSTWGIRQHYLNFCDNTWIIQRDCGFKYDSSWGWTSRIGYKDEKKTPFFPFDDHSFCEIPMTLMDAPFSSTANKWQAFEELMDIADKNNSYLVINYHNNNFSNSEFLDYDKDYIQIIERLRARGACFMTLKEAYERIMKLYV